MNLLEDVCNFFFINIGKCLTWFFCIVLFYAKSCRLNSNPTKKKKKCLKLSLLEIWVIKSEISENKCTYFKVFKRPCRHDIMHLLMPSECPYGIKTICSCRKKIASLYSSTQYTQMSSLRQSRLVLWYHLKLYLAFGVTSTY